MDIIDIHCHILPHVDDGAETMEEARQILEEAYKQGVRYIIATPHYRPEMFESSMRRVLDSYRRLSDIAREAGVRISLGCEYYLNEKMVSHFKNKVRPTMAGSKYVLCEFSTNDLFPTIRNYVYELTIHGYKPIIAHAERYFCCRELENIRELKALGAYIQLNAGSVSGEEAVSYTHLTLPTN